MQEYLNTPDDMQPGCFYRYFDDFYNWWLYVVKVDKDYIVAHRHEYNTCNVEFNVKIDKSLIKVEHGSYILVVDNDNQKWNKTFAEGYEDTLKEIERYINKLYRLTESIEGVDVNVFKNRIKSQL